MTIAMPPEPIMAWLPTSETSLDDAAVRYASHGLRIMAVHSILTPGTRATAKCACHRADCKSQGKHPIDGAWQKKATTDVDQVRDDRARHRGSNVGLALGGDERLVAIDIDGAPGRASWARLESEHGAFPVTLTSRSGRADGGEHRLFRVPAHLDLARIKTRSATNGLAGIDTRGIGGQIVVPPSVHYTGALYQWDVAAPIADLPDALFEAIAEKPRPVSTPRPSSPAVRPDALLERRAAKYVDACQPAIQGSGGSDQALGVARKLWAFVLKGMSETYARGLLDGYCARCLPPWPEKEIDHKWDSAKKSRVTPEIEDRPRLGRVVGGRGLATGVAPGMADDDGTPPPGGTGGGDSGGSPEPDWRSELLWTASKSGADRLPSHVENVVRILQLDPPWKGRITYDAFASRVAVSDLPWDEYARPSHHAGIWTDADGTRLSGWLRRKFHAYGFAPTVQDCDRGVDVVAEAHAFHPVRDYLDSLAWDGTARLTTWLSTHLGADANPYHAMVGRWWLIGAVARIYQPGCMVRTVPILEGPQELGKSSAVRALASPKWFNDTPIDIGSKDAYQAIQGYWFIELAELDSLMRADPSRSKAFFSSAIDKFRPPYGRRIVESPRQCIFVGTVNPPYEYLNDPSGGTRYHPIRCTRIDLAGIQRDRDQLWAEAVHEYRDGAEWYVESAVDRAMLGEEQHARTRPDSWEDIIKAFVDRDAARDEYTTGEILEFALKVLPEKHDRAAQTRVGGIMVAEIGWDVVESKAKNMPRRRYVRPVGSR